MNKFQCSDEIAIPVFYYDLLRIQKKRIYQKIRIYFDQKNIHTDILFFSNTNHFEIYFFKDKAIQDMKEYIENMKIEKNEDVILFDLYEKSIYDKSKSEMRRSINLDENLLWNGQIITKNINLKLFNLSDIENSSYYNCIKPNYHKYIDQKLSDPVFFKEIKDFIEYNFSYPFNNMELNSIEKEEFIYNHNTIWHLDFLYDERFKSEKYNLIYSLFEALYKKNKNYFINDVVHEETKKELKIKFLIQDQKKYQYEIIYVFEIKQKLIIEEFSGEEISYILPDYLLIETKKYISSKVEKNIEKRLNLRFFSIF